LRELLEVSGRANKYRATQVSEPRFDRGIGERRVDLCVEPIDYLGGRVPRHANARAAQVALSRCPGGLRAGTVGQRRWLYSMDRVACPPFRVPAARGWNGGTARS